MSDTVAFDLEVLGAYNDGLLERKAALYAELKEVEKEWFRNRVEIHKLREELAMSDE